MQSHVTCQSERPPLVGLESPGCVGGSARSTVESSSDVAGVRVGTSCSHVPAASGGVIQRLSQHMNVKRSNATTFFRRISPTLIDKDGNSLSDCYFLCHCAWLSIDGADGAGVRGLASVSATGMEQE